MSYDLLVFDLDGTLADTADDIAGALQRTFVRMGRAPVTREKVVASIGSGVRKLIERTTTPPIEPVVEAFFKEYSENLVVKTRLFPGVAETLERLAPPKIVLSNKPEAMSIRVVEDLGIARHFQAVYGGDSFPVRKPDPEGYRRAVNGASRVLMVGDSVVDVQTARNGGATSCAVTYGYANPGDLDGADHRIDRFDQLVDLVS